MVGTRVPYPSMFRGRNVPCRGLYGDLDTYAGDRVDYYAFTIAERLALSVGVDEQTIDLAVKVEDAHGEALIESWPPAADPNGEWLKTVLAPGAYYVRVEPVVEGSTRYRLRFALKVPVEPSASVSGDALELIWGTPGTPLRHLRSATSSCAWTKRWYR